MIEDDFALRWALADYLEGEGFEVESAADGLEGLWRIEAPGQPKPAAILLDLMMPRMGGLEFCARQRQSASAIPVILMTGARIDKRDLRALGLHTPFSKPLNMTKLVQTLREIVSTVQH
jgi:two-component system, chemotaxis family, chemotaxis protein CheY